MNTQDFCYWLQGYFELAMTPTKEGLTPQQVEVIKEHLQLVFKKETVKTVPDLTDEKLQDLKDRLYGAGKYSLKPWPEDMRGEDYLTKYKPIEIVCSGANTHIDLSKVSCTGANRHVDHTNPGVPAPPEPSNVTFKAGSYPLYGGGSHCGGGSHLI